MRTIFVDPDTFKCYVENDGTKIAVETTFFDAKCDAFVEGYIFVPKGETWTRSDGMVFHGEMITPWKPYAELDNAQREYEKQLLKEYEAELAEMDAALLEVQYQSLTEGL